MGRVELPEGAGQAGRPRGDAELETIAGRLVQLDFRGRARKTAPTEAVARVHRSRIWKRRRRGGGDCRLPGRSYSGAVNPEQRNRSQPNSRDHSHNNYRARKNTRTCRVFFQINYCRKTVTVSSGSRRPAKSWW